jgi:hypothetical protein
MQLNISYFKKQPILWIFLSAFILRLLPEILSYPYPIGFDTIYYAWRIQSGVIWWSPTSVFSTWLFYGLMISLHSFLQTDPFFLIKAMAPLLYGLNASGIYYFARKGLNWSPRASSLASVFFMFQMASLRLSWDLHRNMFGLGILLFALPWIFRIESWKGYFMFFFLSILVVLSHEYVGLTLAVILLGLLLIKLVKRETMSALKIGVAALPSLVFLIALVYFAFFASTSVKTNVIEVADVIYPASGNPSFFVNYLNSNYLVSYASYSSLFVDVLVLFSVLYLLALPLVLTGYFRHVILDFWVLFLLGGVFNALLFPFFAVNFWDRLMYMLAYPFAFYAVNGLLRVHESGRSIHLKLSRLGSVLFTKRKAEALFVASILLGAAYITMPPSLFTIGTFSVSMTTAHLPSIVLANTVLLEDTGDLIEALTWLKTQLSHRDEGSFCIIVQDSLLWWSKLYLGDQYSLFRFFKYANDAVHMALQQGFSTVFFVWWKGKSNLYSISVPSSLVSIFENRRFSVFQYASAFS